MTPDEYTEYAVDRVNFSALAISPDNAQGFDYEADGVVYKNFTQHFEVNVPLLHTFIDAAISA